MNPKSMQRTAGHTGFTLIELLIAVTIVSILMAIAVPSYQNHLRRGAIEDALSAMSSGRVSIEQFYLDKHTYLGLPCPVNTDKFTFTCDDPVATSTSYKVTATGAGMVADFVYTLDQTGARSTTSPWGNGACWITRKGGSC